MKRTISAVLVLVLLSTLFYGCAVKSDEDLIKDRMDSFLMAYNSGDMDGVLNCLDAKTRNTYKSAMNITSGLIGMAGLSISMSDLFGLSVGVASDGDLLGFEDMEITIQSDTKATVSAVMHYEDYESSYSKNVKFTLVKEDGDWYICG